LVYSPCFSIGKTRLAPAPPLASHTTSRCTTISPPPCRAQLGEHRRGPGTGVTDQWGDGVLPV
jgi:hypothetical protein